MIEHFGITPPVKLRRRTLFLGATTLAGLNMPDACPACFWMKMTCGRSMPYQLPMPGLLRTTDQLLKRAVREALEATGRLPSWMPVLGRVRGQVPGLSYRTFKCRDAASNVVLCGEPDLMLEMEDGTLHLVEFKAARFSRRHEELRPIFDAQLGCYAFIARRLGRRLPGPVSGLTLVFAQPDESWVGPPEERFFSLRFKAKSFVVSLDVEDRIPELLQEARYIVNEAIELGRAPAHRRGCPDLDNMARLMDAHVGDPWVAYWGRYSNGECVLCGESKTLDPDRPFCFDCLRQDW